MADKCLNCKFWNNSPNDVELPNGETVVQSGSIENAGGTGKEIAKCTKVGNFWENITRAVVTQSFFDDAQKKSVMNHAGIIGVGEDDLCALFEAIEVAEITVTGKDGFTYVENGLTLQMEAAVLPTNAGDTSVTWSVINGTGTATIGLTGVLTGTSVGTVTVRATANDGSGVYGEMVVNVVVLVSSIAVSGFGGATTVPNGGTLNMVAVIAPINATNQIVTWSVTNGTGAAIIDSFGTLTGGDLGTVTVRATATDGSGEYGEFVITVV